MVRRFLLRFLGIALEFGVSRNWNRPWCWKHFSVMLGYLIIYICGVEVHMCQYEWTSLRGCCNWHLIQNLMTGRINSWVTELMTNLCSLILQSVIVIVGQSLGSVLLLFHFL